jgi:hypothetical protein
MSKFVSNELETFDFGDGEWLKIPKEFSLEDSERMAEMGKADKAFELLAFMIKEWNFKDEQGEVAPLSLDNIKKLKIDVFKRLSKIIQEKLALSKKKLPTSGEPSEDTEEIQPT